MYISNGYTNPSITQKICGIVFLLIVLFQVCAGYIINENGQLVPFRLYKKGMCFLHPRNCRGGFRKRLIDDPVPDEISRNLYELKVYKRKHQTTENHENFEPSYRIDDDVLFAPGYKEHSIERLSHTSNQNDPNNYDTEKLNDDMYGLIPSLKSDYFKNNINEIGISDTDLETLRGMKEANLLFDDISSRLEQVAEPPPLETNSRVQAEIQKYPAYELLEDYDTRYRDDVDHRTEDINVFSPTDTADLYAFRRQM